MIVLGFSGISGGDLYERRYKLRFVGHDAAVALLVDGRVVFAVEEERLSRRKHTSALPTHAVHAALDHAGLTLRDIDRFVYAWHATPARIANMFLRHPIRIPPWHWPSLAFAGVRVIRDLMSPVKARRDLARALSSPTVARRTIAVPHHMTHAACAYFSSPFERAAILTVDGQGEDESATLGEYLGARYRPFGRVATPDSIGILYGMVTDFLGMRAAWDEYKVMGMASYGDPERFARAFTRLVRLRPEGRYRTFRTAMAEADDRLRIDRPPDIVAAVAELLAREQIVAWFQGRLEYGPRALGHRSILASPLRRGMRDAINERIKHREQFRPFAGSIPVELASEYFELRGPSPYMQFVVRVREDTRAQLAAVVHHGTCRVQTVAASDDPLFHRLLSEFGQRTGTPVVLNTSFNDADDPIVCSPHDAIRTFLSTDLDALAIGPFLVRKRSSTERSAAT